MKKQRMCCEHAVVIAQCALVMAHFYIDMNLTKAMKKLRISLFSGRYLLVCVEGSSKLNLSVVKEKQYL